MRFGWMVVAAVISLAVPVGAQTMPSDSKSALTPAEKMLNDMLQPAPAAAGPATKPSEFQTMRPEGYTSPHPGPQLLREGSDVITRHGYLKKLADSPYPQLVFTGGPSGSNLAPMLVLPNLQLMSMEDAASETKENRTFTVSGVVTEYKGKNYILLEPGPEEVSRQMSQPNLTETSRGPVSADQMLSEMLSADSQSPGSPPQMAAPQTDLASGSGALPPKAPAVMVLPERSQIFDRVCRLSRSADGMHEELTLESDGTALQDPPLIVLPNLKLMSLEGASGDPTARFRVTGMITEYRGRNYILLQKVVVMAESDRQF